jgi:acetolactate synthase-1/2/3 large subunit
LAAPEKAVVAALAMALHVQQLMVAHCVDALPPILTIIFNSRYGAAWCNVHVQRRRRRRKTAASWPTQPSPAFEAAVIAQGGHGERVEKPADLAAALKRARDVVVNEKRQALLNVIVPY